MNQKKIISKEIYSYVNLNLNLHTAPLASSAIDIRDRV